MKQTEPINIAIADGDALIREGLAALISKWPEFDVVIKAANDSDLIKQLSSYTNPIICLLSIGLPGMDTFLTSYKYSTKFENVLVMALGQYHSEYMQTQLIKSEVSGYLLKSYHPKELKKALLTISKNGLYYAHLTKEKYDRIVSNKEQFVTVTAKQRLLLQHITNGLSYVEIADKMRISNRSVEGRKDVLAKHLNIRSKEGLILFGIKTGLVQLT